MLEFKALLLPKNEDERARCRIHAKTEQPSFRPRVRAERHQRIALFFPLGKLRVAQIRTLKKSMGFHRLIALFKTASDLKTRFRPGDTRQSRTFKICK